MFVRRSGKVVYTKIACFVQKEKTFYIHSVENELSKLVDPPICKKLRSWLSQFSQYTIFFDPIPIKVSRRSIQPYFHSNLPKQSPSLAQPYMSYRNPNPLGDNPPVDPSLALIGFHPSYHYHKTETAHSNKLACDLYNSTCHKYELLKSALKKNKEKKKNNNKIKSNK